MPVRRSFGAKDFNINWKNWFSRRRWMREGTKGRTHQRRRRKKNFEILTFPSQGENFYLHEFISTEDFFIKIESWREFSSSSDKWTADWEFIACWRVNEENVEMEYNNFMAQYIPDERRWLNNALYREISCRILASKFLEKVLSSLPTLIEVF